MVVLEPHLLLQVLQLHTLVEVEGHHIQLLAQQAQVELVEVVEVQVMEMAEAEVLQLLELQTLVVVEVEALMAQIILVLEVRV
jgi:hypothetical protein